MTAKTPEFDDIVQRGGEDDGEATMAAKSRQVALRKRVVSELAGAGVMTGLLNPVGGDNWDLEQLPSDGRIVVTGSKDPRTVIKLWRWVRLRRTKKGWGALVTPSMQIGGAPEVRIPLQDFAKIVGELDQLKLSRDREESKK